MPAYEPPRPAETVEEFYRGKTITMIVGTGAGAGAVSLSDGARRR